MRSPISRQVSPISRQVSRGTDVPVRIFLLPFFQLAAMRSLINAPPFSINRCRNRSAPVTHQDQGNGRNLTSRVLPRPWQDFLAPENCRYHAASKVNWITDPMALPVRGQPIVAHGVGVPSNHSSAELSIFKGRDSGQSDDVVLSQPVTKLTVPSQPLNFSVRQTPW
jgi:hypothetical protein